MTRILVKPEKVSNKSMQIAQQMSNKSQWQRATNHMKPAHKSNATVSNNDATNLMIQEKLQQQHQQQQKTITLLQVYCSDNKTNNAQQ